MKFDLWSDYHVEMNPAFAWDKFQPESKVLILAGDTANHALKTLDVLEMACSKYEKVGFITGNHDYYSTNYIDQTDKMLFENCPENAFFLDNSPLYHEDTIFLGEMGWYSWDYPGVGDIALQAERWMSHMNDSRFIRFYDKLPRDLAEDASKRIAARLKELKSTVYPKTVVITHTVPNINAMVPRHHDWSPLNGSYYNSFMQNVWKDDAIKPNVWCFGHTHFPYDFVENNVRFVCNPRGYYGESTPGKRGPVTIEV